MHIHDSLLAIHPTFPTRLNQYYTNKIVFDRKTLLDTPIYTTEFPTIDNC